MVTNKVNVTIFYFFILVNINSQSDRTRIEKSAIKPEVSNAILKFDSEQVHLCNRECWILSVTFMKSTIAT